MSSIRPQNPLTKAAKANAEFLSALGLHPNMQYGTGCLHRKILLRKITDSSRPIEKGQHVVIAELEDNCHVFRVRLYHNTQKICDASGEAIRYPNNTCPGSIDLLKKLIGLSLGDGPSAFPNNFNSREFCTHLFDLACLAYTHASRSEDTRLYHAIINDEDDDGICDAKIFINEKIIFHWHLKQHEIQNEGLTQGLNMRSGFTRWAMNHLQGDELESAIVLAKANFVSMSRRVDTEKISGTQLINGIMPKDICYTYRSPIMETAYHLKNSIKDYSENPQDMLKMIEIF